jgi:hypothetical protein
MPENPRALRETSLLEEKWERLLPRAREEENDKQKKSGKIACIYSDRKPEMGKQKNSEKKNRAIKRRTKKNIGFW